MAAREDERPVAADWYDGCFEREWIEADMRDLPADRAFDGIPNVFTSFGYFEEEAENQRVLDGVAAALVRVDGS